MCSMNDDPSTHDDMVEKTYGVKYAPRTYRLSGGPTEPRDEVREALDHIANLTDDEGIAYWVRRAYAALKETAR